MGSRLRGDLDTVEPVCCALTSPDELSKAWDKKITPAANHIIKKRTGPPNIEKSIINVGTRHGCRNKNLGRRKRLCKWGVRALDKLRKAKNK
jgi:hypothetical protein